MSALQKFKTFFSKNVLLCLTVPMVVFSLLVPQPFVWMGQNISIDLSGVPFLKKTSRASALSTCSCASSCSVWA